MLKKFTILLLTIAIAMTAMSFAVIASANEYHTDNEMVNFFVDTGILRGDGNGSYNLTNYVSRVEFAAIIVRVLSIEDEIDSFSSSANYSDVKSDFWGYKYINAISSLGYVNGYEDNTFRPNNNVTLNEVIKVLLNIMEYSNAAESRGGYPDGYRDIAASLRMLTISANRELTRIETLAVIYDSLTVKFNDEFGFYNEERTILSVYMDMAEFKGIVTATPGYAKGEIIKEGNIEISGEIYKYSGESILNEKNLIGRNVSCYIKESGGEEEIYNIVPAKSGRYYEIDSEDIDSSTTAVKMSYCENEKKHYAYIDADAIFYYNGKKMDRALVTDSTLKIASGSVILKDTDSDGKCEVVVISEYNNVVVNNILTNENDGTVCIYGKYNGSFEFDTDCVEVYRGDNKVGLDAIDNQSVVSIEKSEDLKIVRIYIVDNAVSGELVSVENDGGIIKYCIQDDETKTELNIDKEYNDALSKNHHLSTKLVLGNTYVLKLDRCGHIADAELSEGNFNEWLYGYINSAGFESGVSNNLEIEMLTMNNKLEIFKIGDAIKLGRVSGGEYVISSEKRENVYKAISHNEKINKQFAKYKTDSNAKIKYLYLVDTTDTSDEALKEDITKETLSFRENVIDQKYYVDEQTPVFHIPKDGEYEGLLSAGKYYDYLKDGSEINFTMYNTGDGTPELVAITTPVVTLYEDADDGYETVIDYVNSPIIYINNVYSKLADDGEFYTAIEGIQNGQNKTVLVSSELEENSERMSSLKSGVAIQYETNKKSLLYAANAEETEQMILFTTVCDFNTITDKGLLWEYTNIISEKPMILTAWGKCTILTDGMCIIETNGGDYTASIHGGTVVMDYSDPNEGFKVKGLDDLNEGQDMFIRQRYLNTREVVIY